MEVLWKFWRTPGAHGEQAGGWLYRTAVRTSLNELRRKTRGSRHESLSDATPGRADPEEVRAAREEQEHVREVLAALDPRQAELLLLRSSGLSYEEVAAALELNPASVGTLLSRAQQAFRKEFINDMANNEMHDPWVDRRIAALDPPDTWKPDSVRGLARFGNVRRRIERTARSGRGLRWPPPSPVSVCCY